nr:hypothetical protein XLIUZIGB_XLIUZIGB_CDS_0042 [Caudoviricetes sp.]
MQWLTAFLIALTALISAFTGFLLAFTKLKKQVEETIPSKIRRQSGIDAEIIRRMEQVKELLNADRVQIYDFHNGEHYANGRSALKTSCTYEVIRQGIASYQMKLQTIPLSCMPRFIKILLDKNYLEINNIEDLKETMPATYSLKKAQDIKSFCDIILNNKQGEPIGFIAIQYINDYHKAYNNNDKKSLLKLKFFIEENLEMLIKK